MTLVDTNVLIDILSMDQRWQPWSAAALRQQSRYGALLINEIIYAELASIGMSSGRARSVGNMTRTTFKR